MKRKRAAKLDISMASMSFRGLVTLRKVKRDKVKDERYGFYPKSKLIPVNLNPNLFEIFIQFEYDPNYFTVDRI